MDDFIWRALAAGLGAALIAAPLGAFIIWRRMAYFGDTMAHSALLGVALGILSEADLYLAIVAVAVIVATLLLLMQRGGNLSTDALLGILSHSALALGLVAVTFIDNVRNYATLNVKDRLARIEGVPTLAVQFAFTLLIAVVIAVSIKVVGILLITALMIIPAAAARPFSKTPEGMVIMAGIIGVVAVLLGLAGSLVWDTPTGPSVVVAATLLFSSSRLAGSSA